MKRHKNDTVDVKAICRLYSSSRLAGFANADPRYFGKYKVRLAKAVGITQFAVKPVKLKPGSFPALSGSSAAQSVMDITRGA